jgi:hypothetical protein
MPLGSTTDQKAVAFPHRSLVVAYAYAYAYAYARFGNFLPLPGGSAMI